MSLQLLVIAGPDKGRDLDPPAQPNLILGGLQAYYQLGPLVRAL